MYSHPSRAVPYYWQGMALFYVLFQIAQAQFRDKTLRKRSGKIQVAAKTQRELFP